MANNYSGCTTRNTIGLLLLLALVL